MAAVDAPQSAEAAVASTAQLRVRQAQVSDARAIAELCAEVRQGSHQLLTGSGRLNRCKRKG